MKATKLFKTITQSTFETTVLSQGIRNSGWNVSLTDHNLLAHRHKYIQAIPSLCELRKKTKVVLPQSKDHYKDK